jgi:DNA topoisomerase-3
VFETANGFVCENQPKKSCAFKMGKVILQREIPRVQATKLLQTGKTDLLQKFVSAKTKRAFSAYLVLGENGKVGFEFEPREKKAASKRPAKKAAPTGNS